MDGVIPRSLARSPRVTALSRLSVTSHFLSPWSFSPRSLVPLPSFLPSFLPLVRSSVQGHRRSTFTVQDHPVMWACLPGRMVGRSVGLSVGLSVCRSNGRKWEGGRELIAAFREEEGKSHSLRFPSQLCLPGGLRTGACGADQAYMFRRRQTLAKR